VFCKKKCKMGVFFVKSGPFLNAGCIIYSISIFLFYILLILGGGVRTHRTHPLPTGLWHSSFRGPVGPPSAPELSLYCCGFSLEQLAGSSTFCDISGELSRTLLFTRSSANLITDLFTNTRLTVRFSPLFRDTDFFVLTLP